MQLVPQTLPTQSEILALVSLAAMKAELRIDQSAEDGLLTDKIVEAYAYFDGPNGFLNRAILTQTWKAYRADLPSVIQFPAPPLQSVTSVRYRDNIDGTWQTADSALYAVTQGGVNGYLSLVSGSEWPEVGDYSQPVEIVFVAGYGNAAVVTDRAVGIRRAIKLLAAEYYQNREASGPTSERTLYGIMTAVRNYRLANDA